MALTLGYERFVRYQTDAPGNTVLVGPDGVIRLGDNPYYQQATATGNGDLLYTFNDHSAVTGISAPVLATDSAITWKGKPTVKITSPSAGTTCGIEKASLSTRLKTKSVTIPVYIEDYTKVASIRVYYSQNAALGENYARADYYLGTNDQQQYNGWHIIDLPESVQTAVTTGVAADGTAVQYIRIDVAPVAGQVAVVRIGEAILNTRSLPSIIMTFDDGRLSQFENALPIMARYRIPGTCYVVPPRLGTTGATNFMSESQIGVLKGLGWTVGNHAFNASGTTDSYIEMSAGAYYAEVIQCQSWLNARGFDGDHHAYVDGKYDGALVDLLIAAGMKTGRTISGSITTGAQGIYTGEPLYRRFALQGGMQMNSSNLVANIKIEIDRAIRDGRSLIITGHDVLTSNGGGNGATSILDTDFELLCAHIAAYRANGQCFTESIGDWYRKQAISL